MRFWPIDLSASSWSERALWLWHEVLRVFFPSLLLGFLTYSFVAVVRGWGLGDKFLILLAIAAVTYVAYEFYACRHGIPGQHHLVSGLVHRGMDRVSKCLQLAALILLLAYLGLATYWLFFSGGIVSDLTTEKAKADVSVMKLHLAMISAFIAAFGAAAAWLAHSIQDRMAVLQKQMETLDYTKTVVGQNALLSCEIAVHQLMPSPAYTQQLPSGLVIGLRMLEQVWGPDGTPPANIEELVRTSKNLSALRIAYAMYRFGANANDPGLAELLNEAIKSCKTSPLLLLTAVHRKGIYLRQRKQFKDSLECHALLADDERFQDAEYRPWRTRGRVGRIITELARTPLWKSTAQRLEIQPVVNASNVVADIQAVLGMYSEPDDIEDHSKYYLVKAAARIKEKHAGDVWAKWMRDKPEDRSIVAGLIPSVKDSYKRIIDQYWLACKKQPTKTVGPYCILMLANFRFCLAMIDLYDGILNDPGSNTRKKGAVKAMKNLNDIATEREKESLRRAVEEMRIALPRTYVPTVYSEVSEREIDLREFEYELSHASGKDITQ